MKLVRATLYLAQPRYGTLSLDQVEDMLRYDGAFIRGEDPSSVLVPQWKGGNRQKPTLDRWKSFGVTLGLALEQPTLAQVLCQAGQWLTRQHPCQPSGAKDYGKLEPVPMSEFLNAKVLEDVRNRSMRAGVR